MANGSIATLMVEIGADIKRLEKGISKAQRKLQDAGRSMQQVGSQLTMAVTAPLAAMAGTALKTASDFEQLEIQLNTLAGSAEEGAAAFEQLQQFSAETPFQLEELAKANNIILGATGSIEESFDAVQMLGDVSAATGANMSDLAVTFSNAANEGKLMTRDIREFINRGIPLPRILAESMGVAEDAIFDLASQGKISFEVLEQALRDATTEGGLYAGATEKAAQSIQGAFSNLKDNVRLALADIGTAINETFDISGLARQLGSQISQIATNFRNLSRDAQARMLKLVAAIGLAPPAIFAVGTALVVVSKTMGVVTAVVSGLGTAFTALSSALTLASKGFRAVGAAIWMASKRAVLITGTIALIAGLFSGVVVAGQYMVDNWEKISQGMANLARSIGIAFLKMAKVAVQGIRELIEFIISDANLVGVLSQFAGIDLGEMTTDALGFQGVIDDLEASIEGGEDTLSDGIQRYNELEWGTIGESAANAVSKTKSTIQNALGGILSSTGIQSLIDDIEQMLSFEGGGMGGQQFQVMGDAFVDVGNTVSQVMQGIKQDTQEATDAASNGAKKAATDFQVMGDAFTYVGNTVGMIMPKMTTKFYSMESKASRMASAINRGFNDMTATFAENIGKMMAGTQDLSGTFDAVMESLANVAIRVGKIAIAVGIGIQSIREALKSLNPVIAIAAGAALIALGSWARSSLQKTGDDMGSGQEAPALAQGGLAFGPTLAVVGDNAGASSNPEVIAPLDKLQSMIGGGSQHVEVSGKLRGSDIHLSNARGQNKFR